MNTPFNFALLAAVVSLSGCQPPPDEESLSRNYSPGTTPQSSTPPQPQLPQITTSTVDPTCSSASLHLYSGDHFKGNELCFFGEGSVALSSFMLSANPPVSWAGNVRGM